MCNYANQFAVTRLSDLATIRVWPLTRKPLRAATLVCTNYLRLVEMGGAQSLGLGRGSESGESPGLSVESVSPPAQIPPLQALAHVTSQLVRERQQQNFEASLNDFLLATNMNGLEYRLRLAGR